MSKDMDEQLKLAYKMIDVVDRAHRKICMALLRYNVDRPGNSHGQIGIFAKKKEDDKFQQIVYVNYKRE